MKRIIIAAAVLLCSALVSTPVFALELSTAEQQAMDDTLQHAMEQNQLNQGSEWVNPDTDSSGVVAPTRIFNNDQGQPCREFIKKIIIGGKEEQGYGTACRQADGSWKIVAGEQQTAPSSPPAQVYVHTPPQSYYAYPPDLYYQSPIYLSFGYIHRHGRGYRGTYHMSYRDYWARHPRRTFRYPGRYDNYERYEHYRRHDRLRYNERYRDRDDRHEHRDRGRGHNWRHDDRD